MWMARKVQLQTNGKEWQVVDGEQVLVDVEKQDIDPITSSSCVQIEGFRTLEEAVSDNKMLSQDLTYTKVMDKVGGDYHQNVLDGQYSKAILYGNTQVNLCEEDSSNALQIPTTFTSFNNSELQIKNKESQVVAPLIKGVTMVNLAQINSMLVESGRAVPIQNVKGNTLYTLSFKFTTKNTNSGVVIECYDVNGEYLGNVMHKTELGDVVKFTFTTHANATKIHICNNATYGGETIQLDEIMLIEGDQTALDIPFFKGMKSVELVRPLTNLFNNDLQHYDANVTSTNNNGTVTVTATSNNSWANVHYNLTNLKANTNYLVMWDSITATQTSTTSTDILICVAQASNNSNLGRMDNNDLNPTKRCMMFNTANIPLTDIVLRIHATLGNTETATTTVTGLRVFEYDDYLRSVDLQSIGWFGGTKNVAVEPIKTCSKNLYPYGDVNFTSSSIGWHDAKGNPNMYGDIAQKSQSRFLLKKGTYKLRSNYSAKTNIEYISFVNDKEEAISNSNSILTLEQDTYVTLRLKTIEANVQTTLTNIQIERGSTETDYVAHDSRYYEPNGQNAIVLRSLPSGVCDTFNLQTGEYIKRIGEVVFDGSEEWSQNGKGNYGFYTTKQDSKPSSTVVCDKLKEITGWNNYSEKGIFKGTQAFGIVVTSNELTTCNVETFKTWLSQNPLTVQYELSTPITTIIPRTIKRNNNGTVSTVDFKTYTNKESLRLPSNPTFLTINSMTSIKPVVEPITYIDFKTRLKTNTDYSVIMDKDSANKTINLGGTSKTYANKMLVRTPSINLEQNLRISGSGSIQNIMVIEGDVLDKELPYFNGMCNVKMPTVRNCGKNLFDFDKHKSNWWFQGGIDEVVKGDDTGIPYSALIPISPLYHYKIQADNWDRRFLVFLDANFNTISWEANVNITSLAPLNARYLLWYLNSKGISKEDNIMITATKDKNDNTMSYEPYKGNDICIAQGEIDLPKDMFEQGGFSANNGSGSTYETMKYDSTIRLRSKSLIRVKPNTTYYIKNNLPRVIFNLYQWNASVEFMQGTSKTNNASELLFTTTNDTHYIHFLFSKYGNENITVSEFDWNFFQLLELDSTVQLRSLPNGVKDELNLLTGEYIQRAGEIVLDGSKDEDWQLYKDSIGGSKYFRIAIPTMKSHDNTNTLCTHAICDKLENVVYYSGIYNMSSRPDSVVAFVHSSTLNIQAMFVYQTGNQGDLVQFKQWLQQSPITVQYELAEPIISYPRIVSNTQEREIGVKLPNGICDTYNPSTGITVKRVGKVVLDGSEQFKGSFTAGATVQGMYYYSYDLPVKRNTTSKQLTTISYGGMKSIPFASLWLLEQEGISSSNSTGLGLRFATKCATVGELQQFFASNPTTVYYELANPIVTTDIVLLNGVHDDYNPITGLYTKRVGFIELDGSEDWKMNNTQPTSTIRFNIVHEESKNKSVLLTNGYKYLSFDEWNTIPDIESCSKSSSSIGFAILRSKLASEDIDGFKKYLSQNPIKVWYELDTPQRIQLTPYFGLPMPYAYKDGYLIMDSAYDGQTLPPEITYQLTVNRTGQITQNNIKLKEHTDRLSNLEYMLIEATLDSIFDREMQNFELELMNIELPSLDE